MPLTDVRVLDLSRLLPGGQCTLMLADMGADVVKVEEPSRGDYIRLASPFDEHGISPLHLCYNRNKRSLALDLKNEDGVSTLLKLVKKTDVLVDSFRPGVMERLGIGYQRLKQENPALVHCAITGYGQEGALAQTPGHDLNFQALGRRRRTHWRRRGFSVCARGAHWRCGSRYVGGFRYTRGLAPRRTNRHWAIHRYVDARCGDGLFIHPRANVSLYGSMSRA